MKEYKDIMLEEEDVDVLVDIGILKGIPFTGDYNVARRESDEIQKMIFWYENNRVVGIYFFEVDITLISEKIVNLSYLRFLFLENCPIGCFPASFSKLINIESLAIYNFAEEGPLVNLEFPDFFHDFNNLRFLFISGLFNVYFPPSFTELKSLEELTLEYCYFTSNKNNFMINYDIGNNYKNSLNELPNDLGNLISLKTINLLDIKIKSLPKSINQLKLLTEFRIYPNSMKNMRITNIETIFEIKSLEKLILRDSKLYVIPKTIRKLKNLKILDLANNNLGEIPIELSFCQKLEYIDLTLNNFNDSNKLLLESLSKLNNLKFLNIEKSYLKFIPKEIIGKKDLIVNQKFINKSLKSLL